MLTYKIPFDDETYIELCLNNLSVEYYILHNDFFVMLQH